MIWCPRWDSNPQNAVFETAAYAKIPPQGHVVLRTGFEPVTSRLSGAYSDHLNYLSKEL